MAIVTWKNGTSGNWNAAANWSTGTLPGAPDDVTVAVAGTYTVTLSDNRAATSLTINNATGNVNDTGTLTLSGALTLTAGRFTLGAAGTLRGATVVTNGGSFVLGGGTLDAVTYQGTINLSAASASLKVVNSLAMTGTGGSGAGTINLTGQNANLYVRGSATLSNATLNIGNASGQSYLYAGYGAAGTLTLGTNLSIQHVGTYAYISQDYAATIVNNGTITANRSGGQFIINPGTFVNNGTIAVSNGDSVDLSSTAFSNTGTVTVTTGATLSLNGLANTGAISETGATLNLYGAFTRAQLGTVVRSGGSTGIFGTLDNSGGTLAVGASTALTLTSGGTISGGAIADAGGGIVATYGTLSGVTYQGVLDLSTSYAYLYALDGLTVTGTGGAGPGTINLTGYSSALVLDGSLTVASGGIPGTINLTGQSADLYVRGSATLSNATLNIGNAGPYSYLTAAYGAAGTLTLASSLTIQHVGTYAYISQSYSATIVNNGTINANFSGGQFTINPGTFTNAGIFAVSNGDNVDLSSTSFTNAGTVSLTSGATLSLNGLANTGAISETGATLNLYGAFTRAQLGTVVRSGGTIGIFGTLDNSGGTLALGTSNRLSLNNGGTITNGTIADSGGGLVAGNGTLDGVTYQGVLDLSADNTSLNARNGLTVTGAAGVGPGTINLTGNSAQLFVDGSIAVANGGSPGTINLTGQGAYLSFQSSATLDNATLNIGSASYDYLYANYGGAGPTLTFGANLSIQHVGTNAYISQDSAATIVNRGTINAGFSGGRFVIQTNTFTNSGVIAVSNGDSVYLSGTTRLSNFAGNTLTGGTWSVAGTSTLTLANAPVATLAADITLSATGSLIRSYNTTTGAYTSFDTSLRTVAATGALHLTAGRSLTSGATITDQGLIELRNGRFTSSALTIAAGGRVLGYGTLNAATTNTGLIEASGGLLRLLAAATGSGAGLQVDAGSTLELATGSALGTVFNGALATLQLDAPASYTGALSGLAVSDSIVLQGANAAAAVISGGTLSVSLVGGSTLAYAATGALAGTYVRTVGGTNSTLTLFRNAVAGAHAPEPLAFGARHVGDAASLGLSVANIAAADGYSENLNATLGGATAGFTASGTATGIVAGASATGTLAASLDTSASGAKSGTATLSLASNGAGVDGNGTTALAPQTVNLTGAVYAYAAPITSTGTVDLGASRVGGTLAGSFALANGTAADAYRESLVYAASTGASGTIASGGSVSIGATLSTATSGTLSNNVGLTLTSTGVGTSGLADTSLAGQSVTILGKVYAAAVAQLTAGTISFGVVHVGDTVSRILGLTNAGAGALVDLLAGGTATLAGYAGSVDFSAIGTGLAAGASANLGFLLNTTASGVVGGTAALSFLSHDADLADLSINGGTVTVSGAVDTYAVAQVTKIGGAGTLSGGGTSYVLNLGTVQQGAAALSVNLGVLNAAAGLADLLGGNFSITGSGFTNTGFIAFSGYGAGQSYGAPVITLSTSAAGIFTETIVVAATGSNASGYSGALTSETITVTGTVTNSGGQTYTLTNAIDTITGGAGVNTIYAAASTLNSRDQINGGTGTTNTLALTGNGLFDLGAARTLGGIQFVTVGEASGAGNIVYLRDGLNVALTVAPAGTGAVTIYGGTDGSTIALGRGTDTVTLGASTETVTAGGGIAVVKATAATAGALVNGGTVGSAGTTTLQISGGDTSTLNGGDTNLVVQLLSASTLSLSTATFVSARGSTGVDTITAGGASQTLTGGAAADTLVGGTAFASVFRDIATGLNGDTIRNFAGASLVDVTDIAFASLGALTVTRTGSGATLVSTLRVTDGVHTASIKFAGSYSVASFSASVDGGTGTQLAFVPGH